VNYASAGLLLQIPVCAIFMEGIIYPNQGILKVVFASTLSKTTFAA
jgi:hypothetical protein